jgi:hypothetical protein
MRPGGPPAVPPPPTAPDGTELDPEQWGRYQKYLENVESKMPEIERLRSAEKRARTREDEWAKEKATYQQQLHEQAEANYGLILEAEAAAIATAINLHPEAQEDLLFFLDRNTHTDKDAEGNVTVVFRDGRIEIDLNDPEWRKKVGEHLTKRKPTWIASKLAQGGGGAGHPAYMPPRDDKLKTSDDLATALARRDPRVTPETRHLTGIAGGRSGGR